MYRLLVILCLISPLLSTISPSRCDSVEKNLTVILKGKEVSPCRCFQDVGDDIWIGCTGKSMPSVFDSLRSISETLVSKLHVWDSLTNVIPSDMLEKVRPKTLIVERGGLSLIRPGVFEKVSYRLKSISFRKNALKSIDPKIFSELQRLQKLDMSRNKISNVTQYDLSTLPELIELNLAFNEIVSIEDSSFSRLPNLKILILRRNKITTITNGTFKGLSNIEELDLSENEIRSIDWEAFSDMKKLRVLNLGTNRISHVQLRGLISLHKLLINNNSILTLKNVSLRDLPSLQTLSFDRNSLTSLKENDLFGLSTSTKLITLALAANNISVISPRAFTPISSSLITLSLQNNELKSLSTDGQSWLSPFRKLQKVLLSGNSITILKDGELPESLETLALDNNKLQKMDVNALSSVRLTHLYLNDNHLHHLPHGTFNTLTNDTLQVIDISSNDWQCLCGEEWLGDWLASNSDKNIGASSTNDCLSSKSCSTPKEDEVHSTWVTAVAGVLAAVSLVILLIIAWLFIEEGKSIRSLPPHKQHKGLGINSDRLRLINDREKSEVIDSSQRKGRKVRFDGED